MTTTAAYALPERRSLKVFAFDPMLGRANRNRVTLSIRNEDLLPGPQGSRVQVIDYDGVAKAFYQPVDLDDPAVLMNDGLEPSESDPRFHQQMVYAVTMRVVECFEEALGRLLTFKDRKMLRLFPHAFEGPNAFYDPDTVAVYFGYFDADRANPGPNLPGQTIYTCVSQDIIAHEVTHALVDRLRPAFMEETNPDVLAFHEAFSDIVAIFQHFAIPDVLVETIRETRGNLRSRTPLSTLAQQFGYATGSGRALRSALEDDQPDPARYDALTEPHERGSILVAAVFDAFFAIYQDRIRDLVRIASGGTGRLPEGDLHPDLVNRIAAEAAKTARNVLTMCIRAFEYLPPADVTYGDYVRALITADVETVVSDDRGLRAAVIEGFRRRGVRMPGVASLAEESLLWENREADKLRLPFAPFQEALARSVRAFDRGPRRKTAIVGPLQDSEEGDAWPPQLREFGNANAVALGLSPELEVALAGFHTVFRVSPSGQLKVELVVQYTQENAEATRDAAYGGVKVIGGATVIANAEGAVRYVISKPLSEDRCKAQRDFVAACDLADPMVTYADAGYLASRMRLRRFARLHRGLGR